MLRRYGGAVVAVLPGLAVAMLAKPLKLGDWGLLLGLVAAFVAPLAWLLADDS